MDLPIIPPPSAAGPSSARTDETRERATASVPRSLLLCGSAFPCPCEQCLQPLDICGKESPGARDAVMVFVAVGINREPPVALFNAVVLVVAAVMRAARVRPF